jgi:hypothetical protein
MTEQTTASLQSDIIGRVARYPLPPNENNALIPLFEAIHNSIHAVNDMFGDQTPAKGRIDISISRFTNEEQTIKGFTIADNGVGLNEDNYKSFLTPDSVHKMDRGGKGIGRLGWLKVFEKIKISSKYKAVNDNVYQRAFDFVLHEKDHLQNISHGQATGSSLASGTEIQLVGFTSDFGGKCPAKFERIAQKILAHFIPLFAAGAAPAIRLIDHDGNIQSLNDFFREHIVEQHDEEIEVTWSDEVVSEASSEESSEQENGEHVDEEEVTAASGASTQAIKLTIRHLKCKKSIRPRDTKKKGQKGFNWLYLCAHDRCVSENPLDSALGLKSLDNEYIYIGCVSGEYLNKHVNQERTSFTFSEEIRDAIRGRVVKGIKGYLKKYIDEQKDIKKEIARKVIDQNPQFLFIRDELDQFVEGLKSSTNEEEIKLEMFRKRMRRAGTFKHLTKDLKNLASQKEEMEKKIDEYKGFLNDEQKGALAEYVLKRKSVLDFLDSLTEFFDPEKQKHHLESALHSLICPMQADSSDLSFEDHNLWIVDDRLAFFDYFTSDKKLKDFTDIQGLERPDMALFYEGCFAWRRASNHTDSIVLVEFKRPGRDDYTAQDSPVRQVIDYIKKFKSGSTIKDKKGKTISSITDATTFHAYIVADLTATLLTSIEGMPFASTPDNSGRVAHITNPNALVEIVSYEKLLSDARTRNAIFFEKLGIN